VSPILIHKNTPKDLEVEMQDDQALAKDASDSPLTPGVLFVAAFCCATEKFNRKRPGLIFWPGAAWCFSSSIDSSLGEAAGASECKRVLIELFARIGT
jgi:hypothetical protein